jgi:putative DNA primase/helicase
MDMSDRAAFGQGDHPEAGAASAEPPASSAESSSPMAANDNTPSPEWEDGEPSFISVGEYTMNERGLFWTGNGDQQKLSSPFEIIAETTDGKGEAWGRLLRWRDRMGKPHEWAMPLAMLAGDINDIKRRLLDGVLHVYYGRPNAEKLANYLLSVRPASIARCVNRTGWDGGVYVTPARVFGSTGDSLVVYQPDQAPNLPWQERGDLIAWQNEIARYAISNSRLGFAMSAAFAGPLLHLVGEDSGGFHFAGGSSSGKTTALHCSASVYGVNLTTWRSTGNGVEALAAEANDAALYLDELSQVDGKEAAALAYMLGNGMGKNRANQHGLARRTARWRTIVLSTGEIGLAEKMGEVGKKPKAGQMVRLVEIPADAGAGHKLFEELHGFKDGDAFATHLKSAAEKNHGTAIMAFLEAIAARLRDMPDLVQDLKKEWIAANIPPGADGQVQRVMSRFGLVAAAGEIASRLMVLPWPEGEAERAASTCFKAWLSRRGGTDAFEVADGINQVRAFIAAHGSSRFAYFDDPTDSRIVNRVGWRRKDQTDAWEYFIQATAFRDEVCKGHDAAAVARGLLQAGLLVGGDRPTTKTQAIPGQAARISHHISNTRLRIGRCSEASAFAARRVEDGRIDWEARTVGSALFQLLLGPWQSSVAIRTSSRSRSCQPCGPAGPPGLCAGT